MDVTQANVVLGRKLRGLRAEKNLGRKQLSEKSGVPVITIRRIEDGERAAQVPVLMDLCRALDVKLGDFFNAVEAELDKLASAEPAQ